jgi:hypothetical protein
MNIVVSCDIYIYIYIERERERESRAIETNMSRKREWI